MIARGGGGGGGGWGLGGVIDHNIFDLYGQSGKNYFHYHTLL